MSAVSASEPSPRAPEASAPAALRESPDGAALRKAPEGASRGPAAPGDTPEGLACRRAALRQSTGGLSGPCAAGSRGIETLAAPGALPADLAAPADPLEGAPRLAAVQTGTVRRTALRTGPGKAGLAPAVPVGPAAPGDHRPRSRGPARRRIASERPVISGVPGIRRFTPALSGDRGPRPCFPCGQRIADG